MRIHKEGKGLLLALLPVLLTLNLVLAKKYHFSRSTLLIAGGISSLLYLWIMYFFRDPKRTIVKNDRFILSPADGKIIDIQEVYEEEYFKEKRLKISIFMSPFNVHINRSPIKGVVKFFKYHPGKYLVAFYPKASTKNERTTIVVAREDGFEILGRQIAGFVARRIRFYPKPGDVLEQGSECGFIKFGSGFSMFLPLGTKIFVKKGDKVKGGISIIGEAPPAAVVE